MGTGVMPRGNDRPCHNTPQVILVVLSLVIVASVSVGCGGASAGGAMALIPGYASRIAIWDVKGVLDGDFPQEVAARIEREWKANLEDSGISLKNVDTIIVVTSNRGDLRILDGNFDLTRIEDALGDEGFEFEEYEGFKLWTHMWWGAVAPLERGGNVLMGSERSVKYLLDLLSSGSGFLFDGDDTDLERALRKAGDGWVVTAARGCGVRMIPGCEYAGIEAAGIAMSRGGESGTVKFKMALLFDDEPKAKSNSERQQVEDLLEDEFREEIPREVDIEDVNVDGQFVVVGATVDERVLRSMRTYPSRW